MPAVIMRLKKETKGTWCFEEINKDGEIVTQSDSECLLGTLYVRKKKMQEKIESIVVAIEKAE